MAATRASNQPAVQAIVRAEGEPVWPTGPVVVELAQLIALAAEQELIVLVVAEPV